MVVAATLPALVVVRVVAVALAKVAAVHDHAGEVAVGSSELVHGLLELRPLDKVLARDEQHGIDLGAQDGRIHEGGHGRRVEDHIVKAAARVVQEALEVVRVEDVRGVGNVRLGIQEVEVLGGRAHGGLLERDLAGHHGVDAVLRVHANAGRHAAAAHVALNEERGGAGGGDGRGDVHRDEGLALVGDRGRDGKDMHGVVDAHEANVGEEGLRGVRDRLALLLGALVSPRHLLHPFDLGEVAHDGQVRDLLGVLAVPHARVGHVGNHHDHDGHEEPGEKRDRHVERALGAGGRGGRDGRVDHVDGLHVHDLCGDVRDVRDQRVCDLRGLLGVCAGDGKVNHAGGGGAGDVDLVGVEVVEAQLGGDVALHAVGLDDAGHVVREHLGGREVALRDGGAVWAAGLGEHVHGGAGGVLVGEEEGVHAGDHCECHGKQDHEPEVLAQQMEEFEKSH